MKSRVIVEYAVYLCLLGMIVGCDNGDNNQDNDTSEQNDTETNSDEVNPFNPTTLSAMADELITAVDGKGDPSSVKIAIIPNLLCDFWIPNKIGMGKAGNEIGCSTTFSASESGDSTEQLEIVDGIIADGYDGFAVSPIDPAAMEPKISESVDSGSYVITFDSDGIAGTKRALYVGTINFTAGQEAGKAMMDIIGSGQVAGFVGLETAQNAIERIDGIEDVFQGTDLELVKVYYDDVDFQLAADNVTAAMTEFPDLKGAIGIYGYNGPIIADVLESENKVGQIKIVAFDLEPDTITYLESGVIDSAIGQRPYWMGYLSVYILYSMKVNGMESTLTTLDQWISGPDLNIIDTGIDIVTPDTLDVYNEYLDSLGISSSK